MRWTEREYYESSPEAVYYAFRGYFNERRNDMLQRRFSAFINYRAAGGKDNIEFFWPIEGDKATKDTFMQPTQEWWDKMMARQAQVDKQIKHGG